MRRSIPQSFEMVRLKYRHMQMSVRRKMRLDFIVWKRRIVRSCLQERFPDKCMVVAYLKALNKTCSKDQREQCARRKDLIHGVLVSLHFISYSVWLLQDVQVRMSREAIAATGSRSVMVSCFEVTGHDTPVHKNGFTWVHQARRRFCLSLLSRRLLLAVGRFCHPTGPSRRVE